MLYPFGRGRGSTGGGCICGIINDNLVPISMFVLKSCWKVIVVVDLDSMVCTKIEK